jgi:SAM-dependent methyltransferase
MGLDVDSVRLLLSAQQLGFHGKNVCTLGRQAMYLRKRAFHSLMSDYGKKLAYPDKAVCYAEDYLVPLGFTVEALDASDYEGADIIHDLNKPIPDDLRNRYDLVWDGGTLEHVFNFPVAIQNVMQMTKVGGHVFLETPANNLCGHGFYQFSPELFFRLFTPANGFELLRLYVLCEGQAYHVVDPISIHGRALLRNSEGATLRVHARKIAELPLSPIQQSDYAETWQRPNEEKHDGKLKGALRRLLSPNQIQRISETLNWARVRRGVRRWKAESRLSNRSVYVPVTNWNETSSRQLSNG